MPYTIYRNIHILEIKEEKVTPTQRPSDITGDTFRQDSYYVTKAYFSNHHSATIHGLEKICIPKQSMSIAINEHHQVIAAVNHITNQHKKIYESFSRNIGDLFSFFLFTTPILAFGTWLSYRSIPYLKVGDNTGFLPLSFGLGAIFFYFFLVRLYQAASTEPGKALTELLTGKKNN